MAPRSCKLAIIVFSLFAFSIAAYPAGSFSGTAYAQSGNSTATVGNSTATAEPEIKIDAGFATFSYGVVFVGVTIENAIPDQTEIEIEFYNPDGELEGTEGQTISIQNGTGMTGCYCFGIERKYVEDSYKVVVIYGDYSETKVMEPFSNSYPQPPTILFHAEQNGNSVSVGGRVSGGIAGEEVNVAIYPQDSGSALWSDTTGSNTKVIFQTGLNGSEAEELLPTGTYRVVATHIATGVTGETTLDYVNPSSPEEPEPEPAPEPQQPALRPDDSEVEENEEEPVDDSQSDGTIRSPFVFEDDESDSPVAIASQPAESSGIVQAAAPDTLVINGTLASYYLLDGAGAQGTAENAQQLYILSGNWSMTVNSTAVSDFAANFTVVRSDGAVRSAYSIDNFAAVNSSDVRLDPDSMVFASAADVRKGDNATREDLIFSIAKLSVIKIEFGNDPSQPSSRPIYGVVDSLMRLTDGQMSAID